MKLFQHNQFSTTKIYTFPNDDRSQWTKREIVADFVDSPAGRIAEAAFRGGLHKCGVSLFDAITGQCLAGTVGELDAPKAGG